MATTSQSPDGTTGKTKSPAGSVFCRHWWAGSGRMSAVALALAVGAPPGRAGVVISELRGGDGASFVDVETPLADVEAPLADVDAPPGAAPLVAVVGAPLLDVDVVPPFVAADRA